MGVLLFLRLSLLSAVLTISNPRILCVHEAHVCTYGRFYVGVPRAAILFLVAPAVFWSDCLRIGLTSLPVVDSKEVLVFCDTPQHIT